MLEFFQALLIFWLKSCLWYIIYHISLFFPTPFFWVQNGQRWLRIGQSFCLQQKFTFVRFLFFPHVCFAYIVMRPLCTKLHCDADSADIALEVTPRMKIGTSWRTVDTCSRWWCRVLFVATMLQNGPITITSSDIDRENCHYETHCAPEIHMGWWEVGRRLALQKTNFHIYWHLEYYLKLIRSLVSKWSLGNKLVHDNRKIDVGRISLMVARREQIESREEDMCNWSAPGWDIFCCCPVVVLLLVLVLVLPLVVLVLVLVLLLLIEDTCNWSASGGDKWQRYLGKLVAMAAREVIYNDGWGYLWWQRTCSDLKHLLVLSAHWLWGRCGGNS